MAGAGMGCMPGSLKPIELELSADLSRRKIAGPGPEIDGRPQRSSSIGSDKFAHRSVEMETPAQF